MTSIVMILLGAGVGLGAWMALRSLQPRPIPLSQVTVILDGPGVAVGTTADDAQLAAGQSLLASIGSTLMQAIGQADKPSLAEQLRVLDKTMERHAYEKMLGATAGFTLPVLAGVVMLAGGVGVSPIVLLLVGLVTAAAGFFYPDLPLAERVEERRRAFRHAFSAYLDLVTILLAGGAGIESALEGAAESGEGWAFAKIRSSLRRARLTRRTPWDAFDQLGEELGVNELVELASSVSLAGDHGARVKGSLTAKADALRAAQAAELEAAAETRTEKMIVPVVVMILGLVLFIAFGAVDAITDGGSSQFAPTAPISTPGGS
jgi:Flp pilus assembly protein TadB